MKKLRQQATSIAILIMTLLPALVFAEAKQPRLYTHPFTAETTDFGQLESILAANEGSLIDSLIIKGPINKTDISVMMQYAVAQAGNLVCLNLENAEIEHDSIPANTFRINSGSMESNTIRRIILPESVTSIGDWAFAFLPIEEINIPGSLRHLGDRAFYTNMRLNCKLIFPEGIEEIPYQAFAWCQELAEMPDFPSSLKRIGLEAFYVTAIPELEFKEGLEEIGLQAFTGCHHLKKVVLPQSLKKIGDWAFNQDWELEEVALPDALEEIPQYTFYSCMNLYHVTINEGCRVIRQGAFSGTGLRSVNLNEGLEKIDTWAFEDTDLTEVTLPTSIKWLGKGCFKSKEKWEKVWCPCTVPPECWYDEDVNLCDSPFGSWTSLQNATLYVPVGTAELYRNAPGWFQFGNIVETSEFPGSGVDVMPAGTASEIGTMYDLTGRRITEPRDGEIYVRDGRKYVK